jgi:hypothetical protein
VLIAAMTHFRRSVSTTCRIDSHCAERYRLVRRAVASTAKHSALQLGIEIECSEAQLCQPRLLITRISKNTTQNYNKIPEEIINTQILQPAQAYFNINVDLYIHSPIRLHGVVLN